MSDMSETESAVSMENESANESWADDESDGDDEVSGNTTWAKAMSNILSTTSKKDKIILSKAKKNREKQKKKLEIELVDSSGNVIKEEKEVKALPNVKLSVLEKRIKKAEWENMGRVKPSIIKKEKDRELLKIATRGVVHLFNTVEQHQKTKKDAKKKPNKNENPSIVKGAFLDILKKHSKNDKASKADPVVEKVKQEETWSILKDDFMMGAEMKDWDKASDNET